MSSTAGPRRAPAGDEDLAVLIVRRTTLDWVLRRAVLAEPGVEVRTGVAVAGLVADARPRRATAADGPGVRLGDGRRLEGDLVVVAGGGARRCPPGWPAVGATIPRRWSRAA
jgi:2-polyprenyl-6-methoxyphenol hydroxylase-like FAD-dependent oxidoreductase